MDINELYKLACDNDLAAEKQIFLILNESFRLFIQKRVWNKQDSEEIVQEAMLTIAQKYKTADIKVNLPPGPILYSSIRCLIILNYEE